MPPVIDFAQELNPEQLAAVTHPDGPQLVIAGAGSGKTRVITYRVAWLVRERGVDPAQIAAVTFTNKAAAEMKERVEELLGMHPVPAFIGTFHRFALRLLRIYGAKVGLPKNFAILDSSDQISLVKKALKESGIPPESFRPQAVLAAISGAKNKLLGPAQYDREADDFFTRRVAKVYQHYQAKLREAGAVDFDDMIRLAVQLLTEQKLIGDRVRRRYRYLLVDEFQDTNHAQLSLIQALCNEPPQLTAVGDEDQGIYRWRGAELDNILGFDRTFPGTEVRKLEQNYRSTQNILDASGAVVANNENRRGKELWTDTGEGEKLLLYRGRDEQDEARWVANTLSGLQSDFPWHRMAVLLRTNAQTRSLEEAFLRVKIPYRLIAGVRFYERAEVKDLIAYLRLVNNPDEVLSFERVLNRPARGIGKTTQNKLMDLAARLGRSPWQTLQDDEVIAKGFPARSAKALLRFRQLMESLVQLAEALPLPSLLRQLIDATEFTQQFDKDDEDSRSRLANIQELLTAAEEFTEQNTYGSESDDLLGDFLDHVALTSDTDKLGGPGVSLMTLHAAKGLEFKVVVLAGLEEGLLPHFNAQSNPEDVEEERRLLYVGMTRAEERLLMTTCRRRRVAGTYQDQDESRFLAEVPAKFLEVEQSPELFSKSYSGSGGGGRQSNRDVMSFFGRSSEPASSDELTESRTPNRMAFEPQAGSLRLKRGVRVRHQKLGIGKVLSVDGSGEDAKILVYFDSVGRRKLIAKYANLDIL